MQRAPVPALVSARERRCVSERTRVHVRLRLFVCFEKPGDLHWRSLGFLDGGLGCGSSERLRVTSQIFLPALLLVPSLLLSLRSSSSSL